MRIADLTAVMEIERVAYSTPWPESSFRGLLGRADTALFVAEAHPEASDAAGAESASKLVDAVGMDGAIPRDLAGYAVSWAVADQGELGNIAVAPGWRHRGIGRVLLEQVIDTMRHWGVRELFLEVRTSNTIAQTLYRQHGFYEVGLRRAYYSSPTEDALVMRLAIES
jgi:ribosomal-protein-alanine acetyltransferase